MAGVWVFNQKGVIRLVENPQGGKTMGRRAVLVHVATGEVVVSYTALERILRGLGWEKYRGGGGGGVASDVGLIQFHKRTSIDLISLPTDFSRFNSVYMYDLVVKNPNVFHVRDL